ncbi:MAG: phosphatidate cytidylyltransferase [Bdellovibrionales bacterium]|nr:phosphatidate cytidylyltransferase [Bdellovibrionales bacterium]
MLRTRILTSLVVLPPALLILYVGSWPLVVLSLAVFAVINYEFFRFACKLPLNRSLQLVLSAALLPLGYLFFGASGFAAGLVLAVMLMLVLSVTLVEQGDHEPLYAAFVPAALSGLCYTGVLGTFLVACAAQPRGNVYIAWLFLVVILTDSSAYFAGRAIGGTKLSPRISPNKTLSGALAGLIGAIGGGVLGGYLLAIHPNLALCAGMGLGAGALAELGDLVESLMKRIYGVKDSGSLLPGHGGLLDRLDALLFALPILSLWGQG